MSFSVTISESRIPTPLEVRAVSTRRQQAAVREGLGIVKDRAQSLAAPHKRSGRYARSFVIDFVKRDGEIIVGQLTNVAPYAEILEEGRGPVRAKPGYVLVKDRRGNLVRRRHALSFVPGRGGGAAIARVSVKAAAGEHIMSHALEQTRPQVQVAAERWGERIRDDLDRLAR